MKLILIFLTIFTFFSSNKISCDPELNETLETIQKLEGAQELIDKVLQDGPVEMKQTENFPFKAYWDSTTRTIGVKQAANPYFSILFELHNAAAQKEFEAYDSLAAQRKISRADYVEAVEWIEYQNTFKTAALVEAGIRQGLFPPNSQTYYSSTFEEHLSDQRATGHSAWIAGIYDDLAS